MNMCIYIVLGCGGTISLSFQLMACGPGHPCSDYVVAGEDFYDGAQDDNEGGGFAS